MRKLMTCAFALTFAATSAVAVEYRGQVVSIRDGDTFSIRAGQREIAVRLCGVDSPESGARGHAEASRAIARLIRGKVLRCVQVGGGTPCDGRSRPTNRDRIVAQCFLGDADIAAVMVRNGHACDWPRFSGGHYWRDAGCTNPR